MSVQINGGRESNEGNFLPLLGKLVLTVADVEGAAGELIVLNSGPSAIPSAWAQSGKQLNQSLQKCFEREDFQRMCDDLLKLLPQRNLLMHGEWMFLDPQSDVAWVMNRKHIKGVDPIPNYDWASVSVRDVERLIEAYKRVLDGLSGYIGEAMGLVDGKPEAWSANGNG